MRGNPLQSIPHTRQARTLDTAAEEMKALLLAAWWPRLVGSAEDHGGCDAATGDGVQPEPLYASPVSLSAQRFGSAGAAPSPASTIRGCARYQTCGQCASVGGCGWCSNAYSQSCVSVEAGTPAGCACAEGVIDALASCPAGGATAEQVDRVNGTRPPCHAAAAAGTVVFEVGADGGGGGGFFGCTGATGVWVDLGGDGDAVLPPPVLVPVVAAALPWIDDLSRAGLTRLDPAPLTVFQRASVAVDVELAATGCLVEAEAVAGVSVSVPAGLPAGDTGVRISGLANEVNLALQAVSVGCYCIGAAVLRATVASAGASNRTHDIPLTVGAADTTTVRGSVRVHPTGALEPSAAVQLAFKGIGQAPDCAMGSATSGADGTYALDVPTEYLGGKHQIEIAVSADSGGAANRLLSGLAALPAGTVVAPDARLMTPSAATGAVEGSVISAASGEGLGGASISLQAVVAPGATAAAPSLAVSDAHGSFAFAAVAEGAYWLRVTRPFAVRLEQIFFAEAGAVASALAPLAQERRGDGHLRAVLQWGDGDLSPQIRASGCAGGGVVDINAANPVGCDSAHEISLEAGGGANFRSALVANATASGTYAFSVSAADPAVSARHGIVHKCCNSDARNVAAFRLGAETTKLPYASMSTAVSTLCCKFRGHSRVTVLYGTCFAGTPRRRSWP